MHVLYTVDADEDEQFLSDDVAHRLVVSTEAENFRAAMLVRRMTHPAFAAPATTASASVAAASTTTKAVCLEMEWVTVAGCDSRN